MLFVRILTFAHMPYLDRISDLGVGADRCTSLLSFFIAFPPAFFHLKLLLFLPHFPLPIDKRKLKYDMVI